MAYVPPLNGGRINASIGGNSTSAGAGYSLVSTGTMLLAGGNNITLSQNGASVTISGAAAGGTLSMFGLGNTTQNSSTALDVRSVSLNGLGAMTVGYSNGSVQLSAPVASSVTATGIVSISTNGSTVTIGAPAYSAGISTQGNTAGTTSFATNLMQLVGGNNVTLSQSTGAGGNTLTISAANQTNQTLSFSAGSQSTLTATGTFDARSVFLNGVGAASVGFSQSSMFVSVPAQTNQTLGLFALGNTTQNSSTTRDARSLSFNGLGGITVGYSNGSVQLSGPQTVAQTNQTVGLYALGNTTQNSSTTLDARTLSFNGLGAATMGYSNGSIQVSVPTQTAQTQSNIQAMYDGANSITTGTVRFSNSNGISFGVNGQTITASHNGITSQTNQTIGLYALGNTTQNSSTTLDARTLSFNGLGGATVGYSNGSVQISAPAAQPAQTNQTIGLYALGNTTQNSSTTLDARTLSFNGLGAATVGYSNGSIQVSVPTQTAQTQSLIQAIYDGANSITTGTVRFSNSNGVSFGVNGQTVTASHNGLTTQTNQDISFFALGNTTQNSSSVINASKVSFNGLGAATVGYSNGSIQMSVPAQTNQTIGAYAVGNTTGQSSSSTFDARTLSFNGAGIASVGYSGGSVVVSVPAGGGGITNINLSAGTTSNNLSKVTFADGGGVSFGLNASTITASVSQTNQTIGLYALGNTTQNSSTTLDARTLSFNGLGAATMGYSNGSIQVSVPTQSIQTQSRFNLTLSGNSTSAGGGYIQISSGVMTLAGGNNVTLSQNGNAVTISAANGGAGGGISLANSQTTFTSGTVNLLEGGGAITIASSAGGQSFKVSVPATSSLSATGIVSLSTNGSTISVGAPAFSAGMSNLGQTSGTSGMASTGIVFAGSNNITLSQSTDANGGNTITIMDEAYISTWTNMFPVSTVAQTLGAMGATNGSQQFYPISVGSNIRFNAVRLLSSINFITSTIAGSQSYTQSYGLYSNNNSTLSLISSGSLSYAITNSSVSATISYASATGSAGYTYGSVSGSTTAQLQVSFGTNAMRIVDMPFGNTMSLADGMYWFGIIKRESTSSANIGLSAAFIGNANAMYNNIAPIGISSAAQTTNFAYRWPLAGFGPFTASGSSLLASAALSAINQTMTIFPLITLISS